jgi:acyl transferase domain-containing protein
MPQVIAIIGMACKARKADNYQDFWQLLVAGETATGGWPEERRHLSRLWSGPDAGLAGKVPDLTNSMRGGYLDDVDMFDARLFGISPREARLMDPQSSATSTSSLPLPTS